MRLTLGWFPIFGLFLVLGCEGGGTTPGVDADLSMAPMCTGATFDPCTDNAQCESGICQAFDMIGITVCTQTCDVANPCPVQDGQQTNCNNRGLCRPVAATVCRR